MIDTMLAAGPAFWLIVLLAIAGFALIVERLWAAQRADIDGDRVILDVLEQLREDRPGDAVAICEREPTAVTMVLRAGVKRAADGADVAERAMLLAQERERWRLEAWTRALQALVVALPMLGAGGTALELFRAASELGKRAGLTLGPALSGTATALLPAAAGLIAGALLYLGERAVAARIGRIDQEMRRALRDLATQLANVKVAR